MCCIRNPDTDAIWERIFGACHPDDTLIMWKAAKTLPGGRLVSLFRDTPIDEGKQCFSSSPGYHLFPFRGRAEVIAGYCYEVLLKCRVRVGDIYSQGSFDGGSPLSGAARFPMKKVVDTDYCYDEITCSTYEVLEEIKDVSLPRNTQR